MIIVKPGNKRFVRACKEKIFEVTCNYCGAVLEMQEGELIFNRYSIKEPVTYKFSCPYCGKYHTDYDIRFLREETMNTNDVTFFSTIRNPSWETTEEELEKTRFTEFRERYKDEYQEDVDQEDVLI